MKVITPATTDGCGDLSVNRPAPVQLQQQWHSLQNEYTVADPGHLEETTRRQADSPAWFTARQNRLTASTFGEVLNRKSDPNEKMLMRLFRPTTIHAASLTYGKRNEGKTKAKYMSQYPDSHIHDCGFVVNNEFPFLGATPDGKVCHNGKVGLVEIKCPYSARDLTVQEACEQVKDFCLGKDANGNLSLKRDKNP